MRWIFLMSMVAVSYSNIASAVIISPSSEATGFDGDKTTFAADGTIESLVVSPTYLEWHKLDTSGTFDQTRMAVIEFPLASIGSEEFITLSLKHGGFTGGSNLRLHGFSGDGTATLSDFTVNNPILPLFDDNVITLPDYGTVLRAIDVSSYVKSLKTGGATHVGFLLLAENSNGVNGGTQIFSSTAAAVNPLLAPTLIAGNGQKVVFSTGFGGAGESNNLSDWGFTFETVSGNGLVSVVDDPLQADNRALEVFDPLGEIVRAKAFLALDDLGDTLDLSFTYAFLTPGELNVTLGGNDLTTVVSVGGETEYSVFDQSIDLLLLPFLDTVNIDGEEFVELVLEFNNLTEEDQLSAFGFSSQFASTDSMWLLDEFNSFSNATEFVIPEPTTGLLVVLGMFLVIIRRRR